MSAAWRRSTSCSLGDCVEVRFDFDGSGDVLVRDSKTPEQEPLRFTRDEWDAFVAGVKAGQFDTTRRDVLPTARAILIQDAAQMSWTPLRWLYRRRLRAAAGALGECSMLKTSRWAT